MAKQTLKMTLKSKPTLKMTPKQTYMKSIDLKTVAKGKSKKYA